MVARHRALTKRRFAHAARDAVDVRNELAAQAHRVVLAISLLLRRSLRDGRRRQKRETKEDDETRDRFQLVFRNLISHGRAPGFFDLYSTLRPEQNAAEPPQVARQAPPRLTSEDIAPPATTLTGGPGGISFWQQPIIQNASRI